MFRALRGTLVGGLVALLLSACAATNPLGTAALGPPLPVMAHDAVAAYEGARSVRIQGSYLAGSTPVTVRVSLRPSRRGAVRGQVTYDGDPLAVAGGGGRMFTRGLKYWQAAGAGGLRIWPQYGSGWVLTPSGDPAAAAVGSMRDLGGLLGRLDQDSSHLVSRGTGELDGHQIAALRDGDTTYDVTTSVPYRLLEVRRTGPARGAQGLRQVDLRISYGGRLQVALPAAGSFVDPHDASSFPALYEIQSISDLQSCDANSCGFSVTLLNTTGHPQGQVTATLGLFRDAQDTRSLGTCSTPVPAVATSQTTTVTCRISGQTYDSFFFSLFGEVTIYRHVTLQNPPYS